MRTNLPQPVPSASTRIDGEKPSASVAAPELVIEKVIASSTTQPITAE